METNKPVIIILGVLFLAVAWVYFPRAAPIPGAPKYTVNGLVTINGEPASGLTVRFFHNDNSLMPQDQMPVAMTDESGRFELSSFGGTDGAAEGDYFVTFFWPVNLMTPNVDRLQGKFSDPKNSKVQVNIPPKNTTLSPIEIEISPDKILPSEFSLEDLRAAAQSSGSGA